MADGQVTLVRREFSGVLPLTDAAVMPVEGRTVQDVPSHCSVNVVRPTLSSKEPTAQHCDSEAQATPLRVLLLAPTNLLIADRLPFGELTNCQALPFQCSIKVSNPAWEW